MTTTELAKQKNIELGMTTGIGADVAEWIEYDVQLLSLGAWHDLRVTLDKAQAQAWLADYEANGTGHMYRVVVKKCEAVIG